MAVSKKYAGLPDLDLGTEIYESAAPDLTEGSTADQSSTLRTESPTPSEDSNPNLVRYGLDRELARRRFEPTTIDAKDVNFSDTVGGGRRDYKTGHRRRRRRRLLENGDEEYGYQSDESDEEETLKSRLARLRREAEEVKAEIARIESQKDAEYAEFQDSVEQQLHDDGHDLADGMAKLDKVLNVISIGPKEGTIEEEFLKQLDNQSGKRPVSQEKTQKASETSTASTISAIGAFADRLTALEAVLGVTAISPSGPSSSILPTLETLSSQIEVLSSTLSPPLEASSSLAAAASNAAHLEPVADRLRLLISDSKRLEDSRKAAAQSLEELIETRDRHAHYLQSSSIVAQQQQQSSGKPQQQDRAEQSNRSQDQTNQLTSQLFLDEHAGKITALYHLLPTIQSLQPLLPTVLERLRALSVIHAGAADAKSEMEELESRLGQWEKDLTKWREAVEEAEKGMQDNKDVMKENAAVVGDMVRGLETRMERLQLHR